MTASTVKSTNITNIELNPITPITRRIGVKKVIIDKIALATTSIDEVADIALVGSIPSNAIITSLKLYNDDLDTHSTPTLAVDVGLYYSGKGGTQKANGKVSGDAIDVDCFATAATSLQAANVTGGELRFEVDDIVDITKEAWEAGGLSSDPGGLFFVGLKVTTEAATAAAGDVVIVIEYI